MLDAQYMLHFSLLLWNVSHLQQSFSLNIEWEDFDVRIYNKKPLINLKHYLLELLLKIKLHTKKIYLKMEANIKHYFKYNNYIIPYSQSYKPKLYLIYKNFRMIAFGQSIIYYNFYEPVKYWIYCEKHIICVCTKFNLYL